MNNKSIWITGASSGIGRALAIKFAKEGWKVAISARRENLLNEISQTNENIKPFPLDVTDSEKCKKVFEDIKNKIGEIDISVFCTGIHDPKSEKTLNLEKVKKIMEVNFFGTVNSINSVYEYYKNKKSGQISIVSSVAGYRGLPAAGAYCASKSALSSFAESLYFDLKRYNVRVSLVSPGFIKSPEFAADQMFKGLTKSNGFEIHFPKSFTSIMKILKIMPNSLYFKIVEKGMKKVVD